MTITNWGYRKDDKQTFTLKGIPLTYITNNKNIFLIVYSGPDGDIDIKSIDLNDLSIPEYFFSKLIPPQPSLHNIRTPIVPGLEDKQYDPTNGLSSNGDIIWSL